MTNKMKIKSVLAGVAVLIAAVAVAQRVKTFLSEGGKMKLTYTSWAAKMLDDGKIKFLATGNPVRGEWGDRKTTLECLELSGIAAREGKKDLEIETATMKNEVKMVISAHSSNKKSNKPQTVTLQSNTGSYTASTGIVKMDGLVVVSNEDAGASRTLVLNGSDATVRLAPNLNDPDKAILAAELKGPVTFEVNGVRDVKDPKTGKSESAPVVIKGKADQLVYDAEKRTLSLKGHVSLTSDDPLLSGTTEGLNNATIEFNEKFDPIGVEMNGDPGSSTVQPKKGGKG